MRRRSFEREALQDMLRSGDVDRAVAELRQLPGRRFVHPLLSALCREEKVRWRAVTAMGELVAELASRDLESARVVMRTLMWNLTEECGGIAWGVPEAMGEIMARQETLAREYVQILVSYMREDGNYLEYEPLQRGLIWGIGRLAQVERELLVVHHAGRYLLPYLESDDAAVRGLAARALGLLGTAEAGTKLEALREDREAVRLYLDRELSTSSVGDLASQALDEIRDR
jgi:HEAT repeat protein